MAELYIFDQDDKLLTILSEDTGLTSAPLRDELNQVASEPFIFTIEADVDCAKYVKEENRVVLRDIDGDLREYVIKELDDVNGIDGPETKATCIPSFLEELSNNVVVDRRFVNREAQEALNAALEGTRFTGIVEVSLGLATTNFYYISSVDAVWDTRNTWGGDIKAVVYLSADETHIAKREMRLKQRLGADNGHRFEIDHNIEQIERTVLSYPATALYGRGSSLGIEDDEGEATGGHTRYIDFADVEWKVSNGDPVDKPLGQKWVGDPNALLKYGYKKDGQLLHLEGIFSNQDYDTPEELLWATWQHLQIAQHPEVNYKLSVDLLDKKASLGDTAIAIDREFARPIEIQTRIIAIEYDLLDIEGTTIVEMGQFLSLDDDHIDRELEDLKDKINKPRPTAPITDESFPDIVPDIPVNLEALGSYREIQLYWDYDSKVYISHYEVFGSQVSDFVPDEQHLLYRGRASGFNHVVDMDEMWYYYVRAVNTRGTVGEFSGRAHAVTVRDITDDILFGSINADKLAENLDLANKLDQGTLDWINNEPLYQIQESENRILYDVGNRIGDVLNDISGIDTDIEALHYQDTIINSRIDGISTIVQDTKFELNELTGAVDHQSTQISMFNQRADGIEQSVTNVQGDLNNAWTEMGLIDLKSDSLSLSISAVRTDLDGLEIGGRNLIPDSVTLKMYSNNNNVYPIEDVVYQSHRRFRRTAPFDNTTLSTYTAHYFSVEKGEAYTISIKVKPEKALNLRLHTNGKVTACQADKWTTLFYTYIAGADENTRFMGIYGHSFNADSGWIEYKEAKAEKGNIPTDWSPAPEDKADINQLISYINLSTEGIRIHGQRVHITGQTIIDDAVIGTAALANGSVTNLKIGTGAVDTLQVKDGAINNAKIANLNADKINAGAIRGIDIYGAKFRSTSGTDWMEIVGGNMHLDQANGRYVNVNPDGLFGYNASGSVRFQANSTLVTSSAFGTSNANVYLAAQGGNEARVVDIAGIPGSGSIGDYSYLPIRASGFYGNFWNINPAISATHLYARPLSNGELRVTLNGTTDIYQPLRAESVKANVFEVNSLSGSSNHLYVKSRAAGEIRATVSGTIDNYVAVRASGFYGNFIDRGTDSAGSHLYVRPAGDPGELRVTVRGTTDVYRPVRALSFYGNLIEVNTATHLYLRPTTAGEVRITAVGTTGTYQPIRASDFRPPNSTRESKTMIEEYEENVLDVFRNAPVYTYLYKWEEKNLPKRLGIMLDETPSVIHARSNDTVELYAMSGYLWKGVKDLVSVTDKHDDRLDKLELENQYLKQRVNQYGNRIKKLENLLEVA